MLDVVGYTFNPSIMEAEVQSKVLDSRGLSRGKLSRTEREKKKVHHRYAQSFGF